MRRKARERQAAVAPGYHSDKFSHGSSHPFSPRDEVVPVLEPANHPDVAEKAPYPER